MSTEKKVWLLVGVFALLFAYGIYNVYKPDHLPMSFVRGEVRAIGPGVIVGPYPTEPEMRRLKRLGVVELVSLMDPGNPVESPLVAKEAESARGLGLGHVVFPMGFVDLGSDANTARVEEALGYVLANTPEEGEGKLYVHCYLGRHRVGIFLDLYSKAAPPSPASPSD